MGKSEQTGEERRDKNKDGCHGCSRELTVGLRRRKESGCRYILSQPFALLPLRLIPARAPIAPWAVQDPRQCMVVGAALEFHGLRTTSPIRFLHGGSALRLRPGERGDPDPSEEYRAFPSLHRDLRSQSTARENKTHVVQLHLLENKRKT